MPDANNVFDYNRYMYGYGNPVKYSDPSRHEPHDKNIPCLWTTCLYENGDWIPVGYWDGYLEALYRTSPRLYSVPRYPAPSGPPPIVEDAIAAVKGRVAKGLSDALPERGAEGAGLTGSVGFIGDMVADWGIYADEHGNIALGPDGAGFGVTSGLNADFGFFVSRFPDASSIYVYEGNANDYGVSGGVLGAVGFESSTSIDPATGKEVHGQTYALTASAEVNPPLPATPLVE